MPDVMQPAGAPDYAIFLIEDVLLALANLRGSLDWLAAEPAAERRVAAMGRIERQIDLIVDRGRELLRQRQDGAEAPADLKLWVARAPVFRSRRLVR